MFDTTKIITDVQELIDQALAADAVTDADEIATLKADLQTRIDAAVADAMAKDAAQDAALLTSLAKQIADLRKELADYKAAHPDPVPTPTPTPVPTPTPIPTPTGWPDAGNTGVPAGTVLKASGAITTTKAGQIIEGLSITGVVRINHANCVMRKCKIVAKSFSSVIVEASGFLMEDCEVDSGAANGSNAINGYGTFRRLNVHNCENCFNVTGSGLIEDCYLWGLKATGSDPHYDNIQIDGGTSNFIIRHNTIINDYGQTAAVMIDNWFGPISNILVDGNVLKGGGYTCYSDGQFSGGTVKDVKFTNNRIKKGYWGYATWEKNTPVWTGNIDFDTGKAIPISEA